MIELMNETNNSFVNLCMFISMGYELTHRYFVILDR